MLRKLRREEEGGDGFWSLGESRRGQADLTDVHGKAHVTRKLSYLGDVLTSGAPQKMSGRLDDSLARVEVWNESGTLEGQGMLRRIHSGFEYIRTLHSPLSIL